jgi:hypothetical protein
MRPLHRAEPIVVPTEDFVPVPPFVVVVAVFMRVVSTAELAVVFMGVAGAASTGVVGAAIAESPWSSADWPCAPSTEARSRPPSILLEQVA